MAVVYRLSLAFSFCVWIFGSTVWGAADLVAHYTFDEGQGEVLPDHSGCANHGKIHGAKWVQLNEGAALEFNGKDSYVDCGNAKSLDVAKELTVELWLKPAVYQGGGLVAWHTGGGWPDERFVIAFSHYTTDNSVYYIFADGNFFTRGAWTPPKLNEWIHYAVSMDGNTVRQYRNGILINEWDQSGMVPDFGGAPLLLGVSKGLGTPHYAGLLDEVKVYKRAIAPAELFASFAAEAVKKSIPVPPGTNRISVRARSSPEEGKLTLTVGVGECRPIRKGMRLNVSVPGTELKQTVPLDPGCWKYEVSLDPAKLTPRDYVALAALADETGQAIGKTGKAAFRWPTLSTCLNGRGAASEALAATDAFHIVRDGKPQATVIMPKHADKWTQLAVQWLARYVGKATGASLTVQTDDTAATGNLVSVGHTKQMKEAGLTTDRLQYDGCRMVVRGDTLFLFGRDELQFEVEGAKGTCKAVVTFLEDYAGVRWFLPGDEGAAVVPGCDRLAVSKRLDRTVNPAFAYSHGRRLYGFGTPASFANHFRTALKLKSYGGHSYYSWLSAETYFKDHPDYFALIAAKRTGQGNHLCSTNPDVATILLAGIRKEFDRGYDWVALGQEDGYARCQCEKCESMDNFRGMTSPETPCERVLLLHKYLADQCKISHPDKTVHLLVYGPTVWPSTKIDKWPDNTVAEMCVQTPEFVDAWKGKVRAMTGYLYWFDTTLNMGMGIHATPAEIAAKVRFLHEQGFVGLYQIPETNWGLQGPSYYVLGKLMGDSYLDYRVLQRDYCLGLFGKEAGATMNTFFNTLYAVPRVHTKVWPEESIQQLDRLLRTADSQAQEPRHKMWLKLTRDHFDFSALVSRMLSVYSVYKADPKDATWVAVKEAVDQFEAYRDRILRYSDDYTEQAFPGYDEFCRYLAGKYVGYYECYRSKRKEVLKQGVRGTPIGWQSGAVSLPLTLDFTKGPPAPRAKVQ